MGEPMPTNRTSEVNFGQELVIEDVHLNDTGRYECMATNGDPSGPVVHTFEFNVSCLMVFVTYTFTLFLFY